MQHARASTSQKELGAHTNTLRGSRRPTVLSSELQEPATSQNVTLTGSREYVEGRNVALEGERRQMVA